MFMFQKNVCVIQKNVLRIKNHRVKKFMWFIEFKNCSNIFLKIIRNFETKFRRESFSHIFKLCSCFKKMFARYRKMFIGFKKSHL